ncbi:increased DNA methylation 1-like [Chenopodium quinoa]|uniref:increased DNA methylation 1-like n=1 Tax=Chenopodium quinoa TaxID=63459 RepID=UPI000B76CB43|nr:increased DNA methylation 1-like [Chenopodium quinoa]
MAPQRRSKRVLKRDYENMSNTPSVPTRQTLPRKCKMVKPFYAVDIYDDEEVYQIVPQAKKKRAGLASSMSTKEPASTTVDKHTIMELASTTVEKQEKPASTTVEEQPPIITEQDSIIEPAITTVDKHPIITEQDPIIESASATVNEEQEKPIPEEIFIIYTILAWIIEMKVVNENTMVRCIHGTNKEVIGMGMLTKEGILCLCCCSVFSVSLFPKHSGDNLGTRPYENIFIGETNVSLLTCQLEAWNRHSVPARSGYNHVVRQPKVHDNSDDTCVICADGGVLICCENFPSTYHPACLGLNDVPQEEWLCPYCHCKYCDEKNPKNILLTCLQCLKKYHSSCSESFDSKPPRPEPHTLPFCGITCWKVFHKLEGILGRSMPTAKTVDKKEITWRLIRKMDVDLAGQNHEDLYMKANCNSKLVLANKLMEDSFDGQAQMNMLQNALYSCGSNYTRTNFSRFYTAILECEGEVISAATLRLPSPDLAEIPFIATSEQWIGKGLYKILMEVIDAALGEIGVEHIIIPSSADMVEYWHSLGFAPLEDAITEKLTTLNTLMFPATVRLRKAVKLVKRAMIKHDLNLDPAAN